MEIKKEDLKVGFQIENIKIVKKMDFYIYNKGEENYIYKCYNSKTNQFLYIRESDFFKDNFNLFYNYTSMNIDQDNYKYILEKDISYIHPKDIIRINCLKANYVQTLIFILCDCKMCGRKNFLSRYNDLKKAKENNFYRTCGCAKLKKRDNYNKRLKNNPVNQWEFIEEAGYSDGGLQLAKVKCQCCGEIKIARKNQLSAVLCLKRQKERESFIKYNKENNIKSEIPEWVEDIRGMKNNELTITDFAFYIEDGKQQRYRYWWAKCSCGKKVCITEYNFKTGAIKSCGHILSDIGIKYGKEYIGQKFNHLTVIDAVVDEKARASFFHCKCDCGNTTYMRAYDVVKGRHRSCGCQNSFGELEITDFLIKNNLLFKTQKEFPDCKFEKRLRFDFCVYNKDNENKFILIEFNGKQHYSKARFSSSDTEEILEKRLKENQIRDQIKRDYCATNNILLLEIPYWHRDKMFQMIKDFLIKNGIANEDEIDVNIQKIQEIQENIENIDMANNIKITYTKYMDNTNRVFEKFKKEDIPIIEPVEQKTTHYDFKEYMDKKVKENKESKLKESELKENMNKKNMAIDRFCNHNPNDSNNTLQFNSVRKMTVPNRLTAFCKECKQVFSFIEENGIMRKE